MPLTGKSAIVTGAASGIGLAIASEAARAGARVVLADKNVEPLEAAVRELRSGGLDVSACAVDIATAAGNRQLVQHALAIYGRVDYFHANAGIAPFVDLLQASAEQIETTIAVNLTGAIHGCAAVLPTMVAQRCGVILLTASVAAYVGDPSVPVYGASKGGLTALCRSLAVRHGPDGIRCNAICPGDVRTPMLERYLAREPDPEISRAALTSHYPLGRLVEPQEIGRLAVFLASDAARSITGTDLIIDNGLMARCY